MAFQKQPLSAYLDLEALCLGWRLDFLVIPNWLRDTQARD